MSDWSSAMHKRSRHRSRSPSPYRERRKKKEKSKRNHRSRSRSRSPPQRSHSPRDERRSGRRRRSSSSDERRSGRRRHSSSSDERRSGCRRHSNSDSRSSSRERAGPSREVDKEERRRQKAMLKALETPEEKRARRLAKKEEKLKRQRKKEGWDNEYLGYTNADNPFGDHHLLEKFVWDKKRKQDVADLQLTRAEVERRERLRQEETRRELEKVKKRRLEREKEKEAREEEMQLLQRMKEAEMFKEWEAQEDQFHLDQAKLRSQIRVETGKAKPIDLLAKYIRSTTEDGEDMDIEVQEPYHLLKGLNIVDLEDLLEDIRVYSEIELEATNIDYWKDMTVICVDEITKLKKMEDSMGVAGGGAGPGAGRRAVINPSVMDEVNSVFKGKTHDQLVLLEDQINSKIHGSDPGTDVGYWEALLAQLKAHMARARLRDRHQALLRKRLLFLKQQEGEELAPLFPSAAATDKEQTQSDQNQTEGAGQGEGSQEAADDGDNLIDEEELLELAHSAYEAGNYSPTLIKPGDIEEADILSPEDDFTKRSADIRSVMAGQSLVDEYRELKMTRTIGADGQAQEEYDFNSEVVLKLQDPIWKEKYRPRKPRFFNRVHTGFEWNKYNQTHYDTDNPPPKIVQGYKFNIFYPDLIDKRKTPQYTLTPIPDDPDFATLRFHAGPPYEDIAFKIVNREWECSWKHGFRSQFNNNILQLWFRFKRNRYRR